MKSKNTLKYTSIFLAGAIFATAGSAFADTPYSSIKALMLKTWKINVNGKVLDTTPISYNNTTYIPLRKAAEAVGGIVSVNGSAIYIETGNTGAQVEADGSKSTTSGTITSPSNNQVTISGFTFNQEPIKASPFPQLIYDNISYLPLTVGRDKYSLPNYLIYDTQTNTLTFGKLDSIAYHIESKFAAGCDGFIYQNISYLREDIFPKVKKLYDDKNIS